MGRSVQEQLEAAARQMVEPPAETDWVPRVFEIFRKVFNATTFTLEQEKRLKALFNRASTEGVALDAIDLMYQEGVRYPTGKDVREAVDRVHLRLASQAPPHASEDWHGVPDCCSAGFSEEGFVHFWTAHADAATKAQVRRLAEKSDVWKRWLEAALKEEAAA